MNTPSEAPAQPVLPWRQHLLKLLMGISHEYVHLPSVCLLFALHLCLHQASFSSSHVSNLSPCSPTPPDMLCLHLSAAHSASQWRWGETQSLKYQPPSSDSQCGAVALIFIPPLPSHWGSGSLFTLCEQNLWRREQLVSAKRGKTQRPVFSV